MGLLQFLLPTSPILLLLLPDRLRLLGHLLQENPGQPSLFPLHLVLHWRTLCTRTVVEVSPTVCTLLSLAAQLLHRLQLSNLKDHVSAVKVRTLWETPLESHAETASIRALRLYSLGIRAALSGKAMQLCTKQPTSAATPSRDSLAQTPPVATPAVLPPIPGPRVGTGRSSTCVWRSVFPFAEHLISRVEMGR